ncbi:O-antigen translocase [Legionella shakespearei]|uniref:Lipopolysaccharide biosynthesis protein n=1 Tax=Legionella shakespearei DSM 23087 TaxID=1122169 RepID=A0A0W0YV42_9GAMM|nr:O-antigen translocase [Legionella shakespearei]KTD60737.1 lipopolysaccharide biosynthesis protein [Legionella shakespearei DSM 23087]
MTLIKTSFLNLIAVSVRLLTFLGINKLISVYVGPIGYAFLGQYQNLITVISTFANGAIATGVTKYTAEYYYSEEKQHQLWQTAFKITLIGSCITALAMLFFRKPLALFFLHDVHLANVFTWFAFALVFLAMNSILLSILNGKKEITSYVLANIIGSILSLLITSILVIYFNLFGALIALAVYQSFAFFATLIICKKTKWFEFGHLWGRLDKSTAKNLFKYALMAIAGAVCAPGTQILVRNHIGVHIDWTSAGYIEAIWRISAAYLMIVTATLSVYFIPKLSELNDANKIKLEIIKTYSLILPFTIGCAFFIYLMKEHIITWLFTNEFKGMAVLFKWQMIADTVKVCSWILMYLYMAKNLFRIYLFSEVFFSISFYLLVVKLESTFGMQAVPIAQAINYVFYFLFGFCALKFKKII